MGQDLDAARATSAYVLDLIAQKSLAPEARGRVVEEAVRYWTDHVNAGFLQYRKSVSTDYTAVEWSDEGAVFFDVHGKEFLDMLGGFGIYVTGHRHPKVLAAVRNQLEKQAIHSQELIDPLRTYLARLVALITPGDLNFSFFTNSGTESIEACLKMAVLTTVSSAPSAPSTARPWAPSAAPARRCFASPSCRCSTGATCPTATSTRSPR
jgi:putrescine aminotransferase